MSSSGSRLSDAEALLWSLEADPALQSTFLSVTFLEQAPDFDRFRRRVGQAVSATPGLSHRVVPAALDLMAPRWEPDPSFDLDVHVRRLALPSPGTRRQLLDMAALLAQDPLDHRRPLWQFSVVEGLEGGQAALLTKMHHVLSDGIGAVRMSAAFLDLAPTEPTEPTEPTGPGRPDRPDALPASPAPADNGSTGLAAIVGTVGDAAGSFLSGVMRAPQSLPRQAIDAVTLARSLAGQLAVVEPARSPLWTGQESYRYRFEILSVELGEVRSAAKALGGTVNDLFVTAVAGAAGAYHRARNAEVAELRMSMPISTRRDRSVGGNAWTPTRVLVPAGDPDPLRRFRTIHRRLDDLKQGPGLGFTSAFAGVLRGLPSPLVVRLARQQVGTVDFACSNVRGAPIDLWVSGARVLGNHPMGPTGGTAFNATVLSYRDHLDLGLNADTGAVDDPAELAGHITDAFAELFATATAAPTAAPAP